MLTTRQLPILLLAMLIIIGSSTASLAHTSQWDGKLHIVYHLSETAKVNFVLNNIRNHLKGGGGEEKLDIVLVIHGPALEEFDRMNVSDKVIKGVANIQSQGVTMIACQNTMNAKLIDFDELIGDFKIAKEGGVTRIAQLQARGYLYIRP